MLVNLAGGSFLSYWGNILAKVLIGVNLVQLAKPFDCDTRSSSLVTVPCAKTLLCRRYSWSPSHCISEAICFQWRSNISSDAHQNAFWYSRPLIIRTSLIRTLDYLNYQITDIHSICGMHQIELASTPIDNILLHLSEYSVI